LGAIGLRNLRSMHVLERIAAALHDAGVPALALKGAALHLTVYDSLDQRPMDDIDLMVRRDDLARTRQVLEELGGVREPTPVSEDFFPRFYYETGYLFGDVCPVKIDLHVRPFRPLRYARFVPDDALWGGAQQVSIGRASVFVPSPENTLIHLAAHAAIHGATDGKWLQDIQLWSDRFGADLNWHLILDRVKRWRLALPVREGLRAAAHAFGAVYPPGFDRMIHEVRTNWRDRLALWQAPRDADHPAAQVLVNVLCTPGWRFALAYLRAVAFPDRACMSGTDEGHQGMWLPWAVMGRWLRPLVSWAHRGQRCDRPGLGLDQAWRGDAMADGRANL